MSQEDDQDDKDFGFGPGQGSTLPGYNPEATHGFRDFEPPPGK